MDTISRSYLDRGWWMLTKGSKVYPLPATVLISSFWGNLGNLRRGTFGNCTERQTFLIIREKYGDCIDYLMKQFDLSIYMKSQMVHRKSSFHTFAAGFRFSNHSLSRWLIIPTLNKHAEQLFLLIGAECIMIHSKLFRGLHIGRNCSQSLHPAGLNGPLNLHLFTRLAINSFWYRF